MPNKLHFHTKYSKEKIKIAAKPFASGGEGAIYAIASPRSYSHLVAKIYYPEKRTKDREAKMHYLMEHPPIVFQKGQTPSIGWVQDIIYKEQRFLGILLLKIAEKKLTKLTLGKLPRRANKAWQRFAFKDPRSLKLRLRTCFNLAVVIYQLHESGQYVLVDLKPDNILMQPNGLLAVVDMDSVEVVEDGKVIFAAPVATPEYTPPEHYTEERTVIEKNWDHFSLGVIFYQLLLGLHPFTAMSHAPYDNLVSIHSKIQHDLYVHHTQKQDLFKVIPPPHRGYKKLPKIIQKLFHDCFELGAQMPSLRPSALDWCIRLAEVLDLPFNLPNHQLSKIDLSLSEFYFLPKTFTPTLVLNLSYTDQYLKVPAFIPNIASNKLNAASVDKSQVQEELWTLLKNAYHTHLHSHRNKLISGTLFIPILILFAFILPSFFIFGCFVFIFIMAYLAFAKKQEVTESIRNLISPELSNSLEFDYNYASKREEQDSKYEQLINEKAAIHHELQQIRKKVSATEQLLTSIKIGLKKQALFVKEIEAFNLWVKQTALPSINVVIKKELAQKTALYETFSQKFQKINIQIQQIMHRYEHSKFTLEKQINPLEKELAEHIKEHAHKKDPLYQEYQALIEQPLLKKKAVLKTLTEEYTLKISPLEKSQEEINTTYENHLKTTPPECIPTYVNYKVLYKKRLASLEEKIAGYAKNHQETLNHIKQHKIEYLKSLKMLTSHSEKLKRFKEIETELKELKEDILHNEGKKIKIESLKEWEESYLTKIYIKDLLLGEVELLKDLKDKEDVKP